MTTIMSWAVLDIYATSDGPCRSSRLRIRIPLENETQTQVLRCKDEIFNLYITYNFSYPHVPGTKNRSPKSSSQTSWRTCVAPLLPPSSRRLYCPIVFPHFLITRTSFPAPPFIVSMPMARPQPLRASPAAPRTHGRSSVE